MYNSMTVVLIHDSNIFADVDCGPAPNASNSVIRYTGAGFDKVAHFRCLEGYFVRSGSVVRRCTAGGTWDGKRLICGSKWLLSLSE